MHVKVIMYASCVKCRVAYFQDKQLTYHVFLVILPNISVSRQPMNSGNKDDMPHPDKANGQQTHGRPGVPVILQALLIGLFMGIAGLSVPVFAETAVLREARMGDHGGYIRVVFEFSAPVQYQLSENSSNDIVSIRFLDTTSELTVTPVSDTLDCIDTVSALQDGSHTVVNISFDPKGVKLNPFMIREPDRVVLDVFCEEESVVTAALSEPRDIAPTPITTAEPSPGKPETTHPLIEPAQIPKGTLKKKDNFQQYLLILLAVITGVIVLLIALIIFQKRSLSENHATGKSAVTRDTDDMMRAIDPKIKEKLMKYDK